MNLVGNLQNNAQPWTLAKSVIVSNKTIIAIEAIEGTDACIKRAGEITSMETGRNSV